MVGLGARQCGWFCCGKVIPKAGLVIDYGFPPLSLAFCVSKMAVVTMNENLD